MKALTKLALATLILTTTVAAQADWVRGYVRSNGTYVAPHYRTPANGTPYDNLSYRTPSVRPAAPAIMPSYSGSTYAPRTLPSSSSTAVSTGYVYRNPYAAAPSVSVRGYRKSNGTYVAPHVRTPANRTVTDNLSYGGFGTVRVRR